MIFPQHCYKYFSIVAGLGTLATVVTSLAALNDHSTSTNASSSSSVNHSYNHINIPKVVLSNGVNTPSKPEEIYKDDFNEKQSLISKAFDTLAKAVTNQQVDVVNFGFYI